MADNRFEAESLRRRIAASPLAARALRKATPKRTLRPEKIVAGFAGFLFLLAAALEGLGRLGDRPAFHDAAAWTLAAAVFAVLTPIAIAAVVVAWQTFVARK